jgi:hypothetical protein
MMVTVVLRSKLADAVQSKHKDPVADAVPKLRPPELVGKLRVASEALLLAMTEVLSADNRRRGRVGRCIVAGRCDVRWGEIGESRQRGDSWARREVDMGSLEDGMVVSAQFECLPSTYSYQVPFRKCSTESGIVRMYSRGTVFGISEK